MNCATGDDQLNYVIKSRYILSFPYRLSILCLLGPGCNCDGHRSQASDKHMALLYRKGKKKMLKSVK